MSYSPILPIDSGRYGTAEVKKIFSDESRLRYMLMVEAAVSKVEGLLKIIPEEASKEICSKCSMRMYPIVCGRILKRLQSMKQPL